jgi:propanol-preferring alcohol dehydrogenase
MASCVSTVRERLPHVQPPATPAETSGSKVPAAAGAERQSGAMSSSVRTSAAATGSLGGIPERMQAWEVTGHFGAPDRLRLVDRAVPAPGPTEVLLRVRACGVCRTDLHCADGELVPKAPGVVPGHEVVGDVVAVGAAVSRFAAGDRVGIAWLRSTCGECRWCRSGAENLCPRSTYTGWDADGGFAEYATVPAAFAYRMPEELTDTEAAPLLCAGIIGYRALRRAQLPPGGRLGIYGFGASAHLTAQIAIAQGADVHVLTREEQARALALELGAASVGGAYDAPPVPLDAAITFAPVGDLVPVALAALERGGTLAVAGIHLSDIPSLDYQQHLFRERTLTSVTANTRADGEELFRLAGALRVRARTTPYPFGQADRALDDLAAGRVTGAAVLTMV